MIMKCQDIHNLRAVLVIATFIPAAKHSVAMTGDSVGNIKQRALPKLTPAVKNGKMKPPRNPPQTVKLMAKSLRHPTMIQFRHVSASKPIRPDVGQTCGRSLAGDRVDKTPNSNSPQNIVCGTRESDPREREVGG